MRRILAGLFACVGALVLVCVGYVWSSTAVSNLTSEGVTAILVSGDAEVLGDTFASQWVEAIPEELGVEVERVVSSSEGVADVYASDMTLGGRVRLSSGEFPQTGSGTDSFVANGDTGSDLQTGSFDLFSPQATLLIHPLDALEHRDGYTGELHLRTTDPAKVEEVLRYLRAHVGRASRLDGMSYAGTDDSSGNGGAAAGGASESSGSSDGGGQPQAGGGAAVEAGGAELLLAFLFTNPLVAGMIALFAFLTVFVCVRYAIRESRPVAILRLEGFGLGRMLGWYAARLVPCALASFGLCAAGVLAAVGLVLKSPFACPALLLVALAVSAGQLAFALVVLSLTTAAQNRRYGLVRVIGGKKPFAALTAWQLALKYAVLAVVLVGAAQVGGALVSLRQADAANDDWKRVEGVYCVATKDVGQTAAEQTGDLAATVAYQNQAAETYRAMCEEHGLVLAYVTNYAPLWDGLVLWQVNTGPDSYNKDPWWSPYGRSITVNENYLAAWPVTDVDGNDVRESLVRGERTENILVPESLREHEDEIVGLFREDFYSKRVEAANYYAEATGGQTLDETAGDLSVNVVYVPDGLGWFSYRSDVEPGTGNRIVDPIVVVDEGNLDESYYYAWMTSSCFYAADPLSPTKALRETAARFGADDIYNTVMSVFDQRADQVASVRRQLAAGSLSLGLLAAGAVLCVYLFASCWYVQHRRRVMVLRLHGWPLVRVAGPMVALSVALTCALAFAWPGDVPLALRVALPAADLLVTLACCRLAQRAQVALALKGEG